MAQTQLFRGKSTYSGDILYTWDGKYIYKGRSSKRFTIFCTREVLLPRYLIYTLYASASPNGNTQ